MEKKSREKAVPMRLERTAESAAQPAGRRYEIDGAESVTTTSPKPVKIGRKRYPQSDPHALYLLIRCDGYPT
jgi:hypothetical protein